MVLRGWVKFLVYTTAISGILAGIGFGALCGLFYNTVIRYDVSALDITFSFLVTWFLLFTFVAQLMMTATIGGFLLGEDYKDWGRGRGKNK